MVNNHEAARVHQPYRLLPGEPNRLRVLIVEDEPIIAMELEMLLEELQAEVVGIAVTAAEVGVLVETQRPDVVTMDINIMGDCDGVTIAREIFDKFGIRSIFASAHGDVETRKRAEPCHPIGWILKPVEKSDLAALLGRVKRRAG